MDTSVLTLLEKSAIRESEPAFSQQAGLRTARWSYGRIRATAFQFARALEARQIKKGDRVLFWAENSAEWVAAFFGCLLKGVIVVPLDEQSAPDFVSRVHGQVDARLLLYGKSVSPDSIAGLPSLSVAQLGEALMPYPADPFMVEGITEDDLVEIIYTSGTTAEPKGVCITHRNLAANLIPLEREIKKYIRWERLVHPIRFLNLVPLSHVFGQFMGIFVPQLLGGEVFFQSSMSQADTISAVRRERVSVVAAVPRQLELLRDRIERDYAAAGKTEGFHNALRSADGQHFLKRWWTFRRVHRQLGWKFWAFVTGGATLDRDTETFWRRLGYAVVQGYGMTETASIISLNHPFRQGRGSIGKTMPGQQLKLDENGEILVRGENVSPGYWSGRSRRLTNEEGWLPTGDVGEMDSAGNLYFKGRKKDVIVTASGLNIYPEDLEAALNRQPEVKTSTVIGVEGSGGPEPMAVLIMRNGQGDAGQAVKRANEMLAQHQHIRRWAVWADQDFPRTATQKVRKQVVAGVVAGEGGAKGQDHRTTLAEMITAISHGGCGRVDPSADLAMDMKLDSLGRVELLSALEDRFQIEIDEAAFTAATTVGDIEKIINKGNTDRATDYPYTQWAQRFPVTWIRRAFFHLLILPLTKLMSRARVTGKQHLRDVTGPALFICNHISMVDHALVLSALPERFRARIAIAMEGERLRGWRHPAAGTGWFLRLRLLVQYALVVSLFNVFPLPQKSGFRRSFAFAGEAMDRGYNVLVFPEGRTTPDGEMKPFMGGIGLLAASLNVPVVPVRIEGLFELKRQKTRFARPGQISVIIGRPVSFRLENDPAEITRELEARVAKLQTVRSDE